MSIKFCILVLTIFLNHDLHTMDWFIHSNIHRAVGYGLDDPSINIILEPFKGIINTSRDLNGYTPLKTAVCYGKLNATKSLLAHGAKVNGYSHHDDESTDCPIIFHAIIQDHPTTPQIVELLLPYVDDLNAKVHYSLTLLDYAEKYKGPEIIGAIKVELAKRRWHELRASWVKAAVVTGIRLDTPTQTCTTIVPYRRPNRIKHDKCCVIE